MDYALKSKKIKNKSIHNLFDLRLDLFTIPIKTLRTALAFLFFKGLTYAIW